MTPRHNARSIKERLANEIGAVYKPDAGKLRIALAFPNTYYVGMSNLGFQIIYRLLNENPDVVCERVFLPDSLEPTGKANRLITMESQTPVAEFDVLALSVSYEMDYPNVLRILALAGMNLRSAERDERQPLVIAGGPTATFNPEPLAEFVDAFGIGDAEALLPNLIPVLHSQVSGDRVKLLASLAQVEGFYVPSLYEDGVSAKIRRVTVGDLDAHSGVSALLTADTEFSNMVLAEVARGCGRKCRFCAAGHIYLPPRVRRAETILASINAVRDQCSEKGVDTKVGLLSASVFDHESSLAVSQALADQGCKFSISSTRADTLTPDIVDALRRGRHSSLTIAPEAGSDRLRTVIGKDISDDSIMEAAEIAWSGGFKRLKLYFMVGLPTETDEDIDGIGGLVKRIVELHDWHMVGVSVSCFVPKPWTPFQWAGMGSEVSLAAKIAKVKSACKGMKRVDVKGESAREAVVQGVLARGDRRVADALIAYVEGVSWKAAFRQAGVDLRSYAHRERPADEVFPWDRLDLGISKQYLRREYENALSGLAVPQCAVGACEICGVCGAE